MKCPYCGYTDSKVLDSRPSDDKASIRRRRECTNCEKRFTTYEVVETVPISVIKKDGSRESFNKDKMLNGMIKSCEKRVVDLETLEKAADEIEQQLQNTLTKEITSVEIGELCMQKLKDIDQVAYVRFASVYRRFDDINSFLSTLNELKNTDKNKDKK